MTPTRAASSLPGVTRTRGRAHERATTATAKAMAGGARRWWEVPGHITMAGRIGFVYREDYLGGSLFMALPSGRLLTYPRPRWRDVDVLDSAGKPTGERRSECSFRRAHG